MTKPAYISHIKHPDGREEWIDRRVVERQPHDGSVWLRDPVTREAWRANGEKLPEGWNWHDDMREKLGLPPLHVDGV